MHFPNTDALKLTTLFSIDVVVETLNLPHAIRGLMGLNVKPSPAWLQNRLSID